MNSQNACAVAHIGTAEAVEGTDAVVVRINGEARKFSGDNLKRFMHLMRSSGVFDEDAEMHLEALSDRVHMGTNAHGDKEASLWV